MSELALPATDLDAEAGVRDDRAVLRAVARLASLAATAAPPDDVLRELCTVAALVMHVDGIGVMEVPPGETDGRARFVHADPTADAVERLQEAFQAGPCRDAIDSGDVVVVEDVGRVLDRYGELAERMLAAGLRAVLAVPLVGRGRTWGSLDLYRRDPGAWGPDDVEAARLLAEVTAAYLVMAGDRDEARRARQEVEHRALHDSLTGLANRVLLFDRIEHALTAARRHGTVVGVAFVDLDRFKAVNDMLGHAAGDDVLVKVARRLASVVRAEDTLARLAGDEFVVLIADLPADPVARARVVADVAERLRQALRPPVHVAGTPVVVTASIGVVVPRLDRTPSPEELIHEADLAMYGAKERRDAVVVHDR